MMEFYPFRGRCVRHGQLVFVYQSENPRDGIPWWSLRAMEGLNQGLVLGHAYQVALEAVRIVDGEAARRYLGIEFVQGGIIGLYNTYGTFGCTTELEDGMREAQFADLGADGSVFLKGILPAP